MYINLQIFYNIKVYVKRVGSGLGFGSSKWIPIRPGRILIHNTEVLCSLVPLVKGQLLRSYLVTEVPVSRKVGGA
jgi:hypothetical protein